jgi:hypothetical protein
LGCVFGLPIASKGKLKIALRVDPSIQEGPITET